jgi:3-methylcrotonyl-CoA carboxylase beta subunit
MWPNARISVMGGEQAASVLALLRQEATEGQVRTLELPSTDEAFKAPIREQYEQSGPSLLRQRAHLGRRAIIDPRRTPAPCSTRRSPPAMNAPPPPEPTRLGIFRM